MIVLINGLQAGNRSGTARYTYELARWLPALESDLDFAILWPRQVPHPHSPTPAHCTFLLQDIRGTLSRLHFDQFGIRRERARLTASVVHYPASIGSLFEMPNMVLTIHDLSFLHNPRWFRADRSAYYRFAVRRSARLARRIIADSQATKTDLCERLSIPEDRIDVIPLGVDERFSPAPLDVQQTARAKYRLPEHFILYVGTLEPRKNLVRLIEAWSRIARDVPFDLVLAGRDGWKAKPIHAAAARCPHASRIHFPGYVAEEHLPAVMSAARAFIYPSLCEGFGLPPLEAMACGVPVLTANTSSLPESVGNAALLVDPLNVDAIAEGLHTIITDASIRARLQSEGPAHAARYTWRRTAELTLHTYRAILGK